MYLENHHPHYHGGLIIAAFIFYIYDTDKQ